MKYMKRSGIYKASNVTFNPATKDAYSYSWWRFVGVVEGVLIFNNFRYSVSTSKHQSKVRSLMNELGIVPDVVLSLPRGIRHGQTLAELYCEAEEHLCTEYLEQECKREDRNERARLRRAEKRNAEYAASNKLTIVEPGVGTYLIEQKTVSRE